MVRADGHGHPPHQQRISEGGAREEEDGAVGGGRRRLRGDAGADGGLGASPREEEYGRLHGITGQYVREIA